MTPIAKSAPIRGLIAQTRCDGDQHSVDEPTGRISFLQQELRGGQPTWLNGRVGEHVAGQDIHARLR